MEYCARRSVDELLSQGRRDPRAARQLRWPRLLSMALDAAKVRTGPCGLWTCTCLPAPGSSLSKHACGLADC